MSNASLTTRFRLLANRFAGAREGNVATMFAMAVLPLLGLVGAAVDYSRVSSARASMQTALDSTALMLSKDLASGIISQNDVNAKAGSYFAALYTNKEASVGSIAAVYTPSGPMGSTIQVTGSGSLPTNFMRVMGSNFGTINFGTTSTTAWGNVRMRVAMALDNTGSMASDGKIDALQTAAKSLIDQLSGIAKNPGDIYVSIVPFAKTVNAGSSKYAETWIDWRDWENPPTNQQVVSVSLPSDWAKIGPGSDCPFSNNNDGFRCQVSPVNASSTTSSIPSSGTYAGYICPTVDVNSHTLYNGCWNSVATGSTTNYSTGSYASCDGANDTCTCTGSYSSKVCKVSTYNHTWIANARSTWTGCIADRNQDYDTLNTAPTLTNTDTLFPANQYYENNEAYCKTGNSPPLQPIVPLSYDWTGLKSSIDAMRPTGGTNQGVGLAWAWQSLMQGAPLNAPAEDANYTYKKAIILLSDGLNTENRWPANGNGQTQFNGAIDARQRIMCDNIKAARDAKNQAITIYTIQVNTSTTDPDPTSTVLQNCASAPENFFHIKTANQTVAAFTSIGNSLSKLRVAR
jgi:Flp pilus assembly protein TadG